MKQIRRMRIQLIAAIAMVLVAGIALVSATYAWFIANHTVEGTTTMISATTNGFILQIAEGDDVQHGGDQASLTASSVGHRISPSSTNDIRTWFVSQGGGSDGKVDSYTKPVLDDKGRYTVAGEDYYAYVVSEYTLYTITDSGYADVYLNESEPGGAVQVTAQTGDGSTRVIDSMRVAITIQDGDGPEELKLVYSPSDETGKGNDATALDGWTYVDSASSVAAVTYPHIYGTTYTDQNGSNWAAVRNGEDFVVPQDSTNKKIAERVGYNGVKMRVYIWMEGTDADCVNNGEDEDTSTYSVTVSLAGVMAEQSNP